MLDCPDVESLQVFEPEALKTLKALSPESRNSISACFEPGALSPKTLQLTEVLMSLSLKRLGDLGGAIRYLNRCLSGGPGMAAAFYKLMYFPQYYSIFNSCKESGPQQASLASWGVGFIQSTKQICKCKSV